ncbi:YcgL domain-containing protein [Pseudomonas sp. N040]|uniref:YcgL domain-containing protein n=1 Tax=Pseudomonas sp. N040 TaxID=2785325 RepID=UPI0018A27417|nr:YcgL domain-containing protein [Pseudomonas sp. N040]MBF7729436.1 YcgL domain-containing protein [Pseudomonas sp. N040]MBW7013076.1 YcgL domain-containing protein [Pseudomonas sp. N040]
MKRICSIYHSSRKNGMYLYVLKEDALKRVPEALLTVFGTPRHAFDLVLSPQRKLAQEDIHKVLENLEAQGYHLQMPPAEDEYIEHLPEELLRRNDPL